MKTKLFSAAILFATIFIACNHGENKTETVKDFALSELQSPDSQKAGTKEKQQIPVGRFSPASTDSSGTPIQTPVASNPDWDSKIIKTANLKLEIKDFKKYSEHVHLAVKEYGAYIAREDQNLTEEKSETTITIKVPVAQFESMMNKLPADDSKVVEKKISTEEVTGEVVDTRSRLEAKKQMRLKYLEFLNQSKNMEEVLQVQNEINDIQVQIESAAGRLAFLNNQSAMSTINLTFFQPFEGFKPTDVSPSFLTRVGNAFKSGVGWIAELLIGLVSVWPLLLIVLAAFSGWKKSRNAKAVPQKS